jgi:AcrR family transcriptional regulator
MSENHPPRPYRSERRREQAQETRARILASARELFIERGFAGATVAAVAERAQVAAETVYAVFGNKRTLLGELVGAAARGDTAQPILDQAGPRTVAASRNQREQLGLFASDIEQRLDRVAPVMAVLADAARADAELDALRSRMHEARRANLGTLVDALATNGPLRLDNEAALDTVWTLASPEVYNLLVRTRGWTRERYRSWLEDTLDAPLLR